MLFTFLVIAAIFRPGPIRDSLVTMSLQKGIPWLKIQAQASAAAAGVADWWAILLPT
jgi:hypothetical protein